MQKRLYRSKDQRIIWGICGGLGEYLGVDPTIVRVIAVLTVIFGGWGILAYIILRFVIPLEPLGSCLRRRDQRVANVAHYPSRVQ